ncbi:MAG: tetratricopeptide (TPR) repeat protein [Phenylobacterium sp.]|jgi:tetratricopeptide (TPR) repeat protein
MGGVGKTAICRELAHRCANLLNGVVWVDAHSGVKQGLQSFIAPKLGIDIQQADWLTQLIDKLNQSLSPCVMFLDNLEQSDDNTAILQQLKRLNWHLVATSRYPLAQFTFKHPVDVLPLEQCIELFSLHFDEPITDEDRPTLEALIALAGQHTLTVELLAKIARDGVLSVQKIFDQVKASGFDLSNLTGVEVDGQDSGLHSDSFQQQQLHEHLSKLFPLADLNQEQKDVLRLLAILPYQAYDCHSQLLVWLGLDEPTLLVALVKKGWLQRSKENFAVHPVVGHVAKSQIDLGQALVEKFAGRFFDEAIQLSMTEYWLEKAVYADHLLALIGAIDEETALTAVLMSVLGRIFEAQGKYQQALPWYQRALEITEKNHHPGVAATLNNLAQLYDTLGKPELALSLYQRALEIDEKTYGPDHNKLAVTLNNLANLYRATEEFEQALPLFQRALKITEKTYGSGHPNVAISLNGLALLYDDMDDPEQALPLYQRSLAIREKHLGPNHPSLVVALNNLAMLFHSMEEFETALPLSLRALEIAEKAFGPNHPDVASTLYALAGIHQSMNNPDKAEPLRQRAEEIEKRRR